MYLLRMAQADLASVTASDGESLCCRGQVQANIDVED
jgi:hypothetical protein